MYIMVCSVSSVSVCATDDYPNRESSPSRLEMGWYADQTWRLGI